MKSNEHIDILLEKYWNCETTQEEEDALRKFFTGDDVPEHLLRYRDLFAYQAEEGAHRLGNDFDARIMDAVLREESVTPSPKKIVRLGLARRILNIAAVVGLVLGGWLIYDSYNAGTRNSLMADTYTTPEEALAGMGEIFSFVGAKIEKGEAMVEKGIQKTEPIRDIATHLLDKQTGANR